jgi:hypothetical protein
MEGNSFPHPTRPKKRPKKPLARFFEPPVIRSTSNFFILYYIDILTRNIDEKKSFVKRIYACFAKNGKSMIIKII